MNRLILSHAFLLILAVAAACSGPGTEGDACGGSSDCGDGQVCVEGECLTVDCSSSADCDVHQYCNQAFSCADGCAEDTDCQAGEVCNPANQCEAYGCRTTELDCDYGETCDLTTGQCYTDWDYCRTCNPNNSNSCGNGAMCAPYGDENVGYCWKQCQSADDCARGFVCYDAGSMKVCVGDCDWMTDEGYF
jgi:hypothetical protein